jgi:hypothetical protein
LYFIKLAYLKQYFVFKKHVMFPENLGCKKKIKEVQTMQYTLMHKNTTVAELEIDDELGTVSKVGEVHSFEHLPVGMQIISGKPNRRDLNNWWSGRAIPASRSGLRDALEKLKMSSPLPLLSKCFGLSLSDQYWIRSTRKPVEWKDVNFFENTFSEDMGKVLFGAAPQGEINLMSPDNTSDGWLKKKWIISDSKRCLVKRGSPILYQEPLNEALATAIMRRLNIPHAPYSIIYEKGQPLSVCEDFITKDTDLVSAWHIQSIAKKAGHISYYQHYINCCELLGIPNMKQSVNEMLVVDYMLANQDRHFNNFGAVRNAETLEWLSASPIFDTGTSMYYDKPTHQINARIEGECKPFRSSHAEQIKLVTAFDCIDLSVLSGIDDEFYEILMPSEYIDEMRRSALCRALKTRVAMLGEFIQSVQHKGSIVV